MKSVRVAVVVGKANKFKNMGSFRDSLCLDVICIFNVKYVCNIAFSLKYIF